MSLKLVSILATIAAVKASPIFYPSNGATATISASYIGDGATATISASSVSGGATATIPASSVGDGATATIPASSVGYTGYPSYSGYLSPSAAPDSAEVRYRFTKGGNIVVEKE
ncbi:hypothetical protein BU23DRAFT_554472 [Bimuria novae-zelandiae CBS 107.79]|uniref:Uncharacterized protein n=1 Tax=Bimuria novae-zelandiae CBS 107.79 TaxID=1447943 RepID=A0A6A5V8L4_9PLEO|nr:hypothetical protein BU23DRAFT_554472 [Bimuria novae-zelandiae CBS 107.79]